MEFSIDTFGRNLRTAREKKGWNQSKLGEEAGVQQSQISSYENATGKTPSLETAYKLAEALGVSLDSLCGANDVRREIRASQWLSYLDRLIDDPPTIQKEKVMELRRRDNETSIVFKGEKMKAFFDKFLALHSLKETLGEKTYYVAFETLLEQEHSMFEIGYYEEVRGANTGWR